MKFIVLITIFLVPLVFSEDDQDYPWLENLDAGKDFKQSGAKLSELELGLNPLERFNGKEKVLLVSVHGSRSGGYEWIYPLQTLDTENSATFFYRWDDRKCYLSSAEKLIFYIKEVLKSCLLYTSPSPRDRG